MPRPCFRVIAGAVVFAQHNTSTIQRSCDCWYTMEWCSRVHPVWVRVKETWTRGRLESNSSTTSLIEGSV